MRVEKLTSRICTYTPESPAPGQLVVICSWMDAREQHISRYVQLHHEIAPRARILLIQSSAAILVCPYALQRAALKPAVQYIIDNIMLAVITGEKQLNTEQHTPKTSPKPGRNCFSIVLHSFSNGGGLTATQLLFLLRDVTQMPLNLAGIILDSSPSGGGYRQSHNAILLSQPKAHRSMTSLLTHAILLPQWAVYATGKRENSQTVMRKTFLDSHYLDTKCINYIYSKDDQITDWKDVHLHAEEARAKGWYVDENILEQSPHCAHIRTQDKLYAAIVKRTWNAAAHQSRL